MRRRWLAILTALLLALSLAACGSAGGSLSNGSAASAPMATAAAEDGAVYGGAYDMAFNESLSEAESPAETDAQTAGGEKIIHTAQLELETTDFDTAAASLEELVEELEGYFENSSVGDRGSGYRWADYTVRVPSAAYQRFLRQAGELCHVTWQNTSRENISEAYYDTAGRLKTQQIKLERLQALLAEADNMADIITIESAISETEWMIDNLSGTLRHYDAQVDYATVHISLQEVYRLSNVDEPAASFGGRLGAAFSDGLRAFGTGLENLAVALAYGWAWVLLAAVIVIAVVRLLRKRLRRGLPAGQSEKKADDKSGEL